MKEDIPRLEKYLRKLFKNPAVRVVMTKRKGDMAEVFDGEEFIAPIYQEKEDGETSYQMQIVILDVDLDEAK